MGASSNIIIDPVTSESISFTVDGDNFRVSMSQARYDEVVGVLDLPAASRTKIQNALSANVVANQKEPTLTFSNTDLQRTLATLLVFGVIGWNQAKEIATLFAPGKPLHQVLAPILKEFQRNKLLTHDEALNIARQLIQPSEISCSPVSTTGTTAPDSSPRLSIAAPIQK